MSDARTDTTLAFEAADDLGRLGQELADRLEQIAGEIAALEHERLEPLREEHRRLEAAVRALSR